MYNIYMYVCLFLIRTHKTFKLMCVEIFATNVCCICIINIAPNFVNTRGNANLRHEILHKRGNFCLAKLLWYPQYVYRFFAVTHSWYKAREQCMLYLEQNIHRENFCASLKNRKSLA